MENRMETVKLLAAKYLPDMPETAAAQHKLMKQLADVVPPVNIYISKIMQSYTGGGEFMLPQTIFSSAENIQKLIGITIVENLKLEEKSEESLLMAWASLDYYYAYLTAPTAQIRKFREELTRVLVSKIETRENLEKVQAEVPSFDTTVAVEAQKEEETTVFMDFGQQEDPFKTVVQETAQSNTSVVDLVGGNEISSEVRSEKPKSKLPLLILGVVAVAAVAVLALFVFNKAGQVERSIDKLGEISLSSEEAIVAAEEAYAELSEEQQAKVENYDVLVQARSEYECLVVEDAIDAIGKVTIESETAVIEAETLYEALTNDQKIQIANSKTLAESRAEVDRLKKLVKNAEQAIDAIGEVTLDSGDKINAARKAYDALAKDGLQSYVASKVSVLTKAEEAYSNCKGADLYAKAEDLLKNRKYEEALTQVNEIIRDFPQAPVAADAQNTAHVCLLKLSELACNKGDLYSAMNWLKQVQPGFTVSEEYKTQMENVVKRLERARPRNANKFADKVGWGWCELVVTAANEDLCVKVVSKEDKAKATMVFVRAGESAEINLKDGSYSIYLTSGKYWYNKDVGFGDEATYKTVSETLTLTSWHSGSYVYYYRYDLNLRNSAENDFTVAASSSTAFWG